MAQHGAYTDEQAARVARVTHHGVGPVRDQCMAFLDRQLECEESSEVAEAQEANCPAACHQRATDEPPGRNAELLRGARYKELRYTLADRGRDVRREG